MSTAARPLPAVLPSRDRQSSPDPLAEIARLKRDLASVNQRVRQYRRAAAEAEAGRQLPAASAIEVGPRGDLFALLTMARYGERHGRSPILRFTRDTRTDEILGVELLFVAPDERDEPALSTLPIGMAVITGEVE